MRSLMKFLLVLLVMGSDFAVAQSKLPKTPVLEVTDDYFGTKVSDPYRWLENTNGPDVIAWMKAQNEYTRAVLAKIPGRDQLRDRIKALDNAGDVVSGLQVWGGHYFYFKTEPGSDNRKLYVRDGVTAPERLLVNPETLTTKDGNHFSIDYFQPSLDGKYVAYGISPGGSEESILHIVETANGKVLSDVIDRAQFAQPNWLPYIRKKLGLKSLLAGCYTFDCTCCILSATSGDLDSIVEFGLKNGSIAIKEEAA
jgi:prolyl oligopeptidase